MVLWSIHVCVTLQPLSVDSMSMLQSDPPMSGILISNANLFGASNSVIVTGAFHDFPSQLFLPLNFAPSAGPVAPLIQSPPSFSGDHRPIEGRSVTRSHTCSGVAAISFETVTSFSIPLP